MRSESASAFQLLTNNQPLELSAQLPTAPTRSSKARRAMSASGYTAAASEIRALSGGSWKVVLWNPAMSGPKVVLSEKMNRHSTGAVFARASISTG
ncbi:lipoprotein [Mycobacterium marinum str. Europe]|nr:lipoprotein [Mycobacterium marinum str. Europe]